MILTCVHSLTFQSDCMKHMCMGREVVSNGMTCIVDFSFSPLISLILSFSDEGKTLVENLKANTQWGEKMRAEFLSSETEADVCY
jgi:hypothetical protein